MPSITTFTYTLEDLGFTANQVKDFLSSKLDLPILDDYLIVVQKPTYLGKFKKWLNLSSDELKDNAVTFCLVSKNL